MRAILSRTYKSTPNRDRFTVTRALKITGDAKNCVFLTERTRIVRVRMVESLQMEKNVKVGNY